MFSRTYKSLALHNFTNNACSYKDKKTIGTITYDEDVLLDCQQGDLFFNLQKTYEVCLMHHCITA